MSSLQEIFNTIFPLNRKERFYTGTVLPAIICGESFKHLNRFFRLIPGFEGEIEIHPDPENCNIVFQTEYSFKESVYGEHFLKMFSEKHETKDTPDLVILITGPEKYLFVCEAKMFSSITSGDLNVQMKNQEWFIETMKEKLDIPEENCFHFALVPQGLIPEKIRISKPVVYWEELLNAFSDIQKSSYFFNTLKIASEKYDLLKSNSGNQGLTYGKNMDFRLSGESILELHKSGKKFWVGRNLGLTGGKFRLDVESGGWKHFEYEINLEAEEAPNRNWFSSGDFYKAVTNQTNEDKMEITTENKPALYSIAGIEPDPWHFSHLGEDYFLNLALNAKCGRSWDAKIDYVYIGKSGTEYRQKRNGRNVNPNWSVHLTDSREFKYDNKKGKPEKGMWDRKNCNVYYWSDLKEYFLSHKKS